MKTKHKPYYIGLMSGTSTDGVDGVLVDFSANNCQPICSTSLAFPSALRHEILALNSPGYNELHRSYLVANQLAYLFARVVKSLLTKAKLTAAQIQAIGCHGQTVRHQPQLAEPNGAMQVGYSCQLNNPALLAELTAIQVVADFRNRDIAAGGQGAPLVPAFHQRFFALAQQDCAVLNLGGIANLSLLNADGSVSGFDTGPANMLSDAWCELNCHTSYDVNGDWARGGQINAVLLTEMLKEPYFATAAPKSTGRDLFNLIWLQAHLAASSYQAQDIQATLVELTAVSVAQALWQNQPRCQRLIVVGGGALNSYLIDRLSINLQAYFSQLCIQDASSFGLQPQEVEATAFAWLAQQRLLAKAANIPAVTGAKQRRVLGAIYPA